VVEPAQYAYENWVKSTGLPVHRGYYVEDVREIELGRWDARDCNAAFLILEGQQNVSEARVTEILPGKSLPPLKFAFDEIVYVAEGQGICTVWQEGGAKRSFEWHKHAMFLLPRNHYHQLANARGDRRAILLHNNYLPVAMAGAPDPELYFNTECRGGPGIDAENFYSAARMVEETDARIAARRKAYWTGNFFPDMRAWDKLVPFKTRGAGGKTIFINFPGSNMSCHMSVFDAGTYKKGHRHGPSYVIVIPTGEGYSIMWPEGGDKVVVPWREASVFVPPDNWYHQHFNIGDAPARYLALHPPRPFGKAGAPENQIEYPNEEPFIRDKFESTLAQRGLRSLMPPEAYKNPRYEWSYAES
jgi:oxalate decarboxylase/phosphoglucose isomerase-like protein (cupin superfamily)